jgi:hypothetical protein
MVPEHNLKSKFKGKINLACTAPFNRTAFTILIVENYGQLCR